MISVYKNVLTYSVVIGNKTFEAGDIVYCLFDRQMSKYHPLQFEYYQSAQIVADLFNKRHTDYPETYMHDIEQKFAFAIGKLTSRVTSVLPHNVKLENFL